MLRRRRRGHNDCLPQELKTHADMEPVELRFHGSWGAALNEIAQTVIAICYDTHRSTASHSLLQKEAIEETCRPA